MPRVSLCEDRDKAKGQARRYFPFDCPRLELSSFELSVYPIGAGYKLNGEICELRATDLGDISPLRAITIRRSSSAFGMYRAKLF